MSLLVTFLFMMGAAHATPSAACLNLLLAKPIPHTPQRTHALEVAEAGTVTRSGDRLPEFGPGHYLYLITKSGDIMTSPHYVLIDGQMALVTHKSLMARYQRLTGIDPKDMIVAAGEYQMDFESVFNIKNKSGNFRGDSESLELAAQVLQLAGLPINTSTMRTFMNRDNPEDRGHTPRDQSIDEFRLSVFGEVHGSERGRTILDIYERLNALVHKTFPLARGLSAVEELMSVALKGSGVTGKYQGFHALTYPLQELYTPDGMEYGVWSVEHSDHSHGDSFELGASQQCYNVAAALRGKIKPELRAQWVSLGREFEDLSTVKN